MRAARVAGSILGLATGTIISVAGFAFVALVLGEADGPGEAIYVAGLWMWLGAGTVQIFQFYWKRLAEAWRGDGDD